MVTISWGSAPDQVADLWRLGAPGGPSPVLVSLHGGFWQASYARDLQDQVALAAARAGFAVWVPEYRRFGQPGFSVAGMLADVVAGLDALATVEGVDLSRVVVSGHSAGGHLAAYAALSGRPKVAPVGAVCDAGVVDLGFAARNDVGDGVVDQVFGPVPGDADPARLLPARVPVVCLVATEDRIVPASVSRSFAAAAAAQPGAEVTVTEVPGDHFSFLDPRQQAAEASLKAARKLVGLD